MGADATLDPRPGGVCRIAFRPAPAVVDFMAATFGHDPQQARERLQAAGASSAMLGEFVEVDPPRRVSFTWGWELEPYALPPQSTAVEVSLTPDGEETVLRLVHRRLPPGLTAFHSAGWDHHLGRLAVVAAGGDPGPDTWQAGDA